MLHRFFLFAGTAVMTLGLGGAAFAEPTPASEPAPAVAAAAVAPVAPVELAPAVIDPALAESVTPPEAVVEPAVPAASPVVFAPAVSSASIAGENRDFIDYAARHCMAMLKEGQGDLTFMLGRGGTKFFADDRDAFNRTMATRLTRDYALDASQDCSFDMVSVGQHQLTRNTHKPKRYTGKPKKGEARQQDMVVVGGAIPSVTGAPVSVVYRFERMNPQAWAITNISFNGQPMTDRFRKPLEEAVAFGGVDEALARIAVMH